MRKKLHLVLCITALSVLPLWADNLSKSVSIEQRLRETDLSLTFRQYERVKMDLFETELKFRLLDTDGDLAEVTRKKQEDLLVKRCAILRQSVDQLRVQALSLGEPKL